MHDAKSIRAQLQRILSSAKFDASERNRKFLSFVVEQWIEGRTDQIKAYTIATDVFGRGKDFDPQLDSIVRIEAGRLRRSLEHYYLTEGADDPIRISIPKGSYAPSFSSAESGKSVSATPPPPRRREGVRAVLVEPFEQDGGDDRQTRLAAFLTREIVVGLTRFPNLIVLGRHRNNGGSARQPDFILGGNVTPSGDLLRTDAFLRDARTDQYVWAERYDRAMHEEHIRLCDDVANRIVRAVAQPHGALFRSRTTALDTDGQPADSVAIFHQYNRTLSKADFKSVFLAVSAAAQREPDNAEVLACLSRLYIDAHRFRYELPDKHGSPVTRARQLAQESLELSPESSRCYYALGLSYWFLGNVDSSLAAYLAGHELNPNDTELMAELGFRYALLAQWDKALPLLETAFEYDNFQPGTYRVALSLYHLAHGRYSESLREARRVVAPDVLYGHILRAANAAHLEQREEAREAVALILQLDPSYGKNIISDLGARNVDPSLIRLVASGLAKAGLPIDLSGFEPADMAFKGARSPGSGNVRTLSRRG